MISILHVQVDLSEYNPVTKLNEVPDKFCSIETDRPLSSISFLNHKGEAAFTVNFFMKDGELMVSAADYTSVPIKERNHWE